MIAWKCATWSVLLTFFPSLDDLFIFQLEPQGITISFLQDRERLYLWKIWAPEATWEGSLKEDGPKH